MTEIPSGLGRRIAFYRKRYGFPTVRDLVASAGDPTLTESVMQNLESGRKADPPISQLVKVARAIGVAPSLLLARFDRPYDGLDIPNLGPAFEKMTNAEFDTWFSSNGHEKLGDFYTAQGIVDRIALIQMRTLTSDLIELKERIEWKESLPDEIEHQRAIVDRGAESLSRGGYDVSWVHDVIAAAQRPKYIGREDVDG